MTHVFCRMLEYLHPCSTVSAALRAHCRFQLSHSSFFKVTRDVIRRISPSPEAHSGSLSLSFDHKLIVRAWCLQPSFRKLTVRLPTFSASAVVLAPRFCSVCCRALASLSAASFAACLNCGFSPCNCPWLLQRPGTVELFAAPEAIS